MRKADQRWLILALLFVTATLSVAFVDGEHRDIWIAAAQGLPVLLALLVAMRTLSSNRADVRVERALTFHRELTAGELGDARWRLAKHLRLHRENQAKVRTVKFADLSAPRPKTGRGELQEYVRADIGTPRHDSTLLMRFFERVEAAWDRDTVERVMLCRLVGRHAGWWDLAIEPSEVRERMPLSRLALKLNRFAQQQSSEQDFADWWLERERDFENEPRLQQAKADALRPP